MGAMNRIRVLSSYVGALVLCVCCAATPGFGATIGELADIYRAKFDEIHTLRITYSETREAIIPEHRLYAEHGIIFYGASLFEEVLDRRGRLYYQEDLAIDRFHEALLDSLARSYSSVAKDRLFAEVPFAMVKSTLAAAKPIPDVRTLVFDGERLWQHQSRKLRNPEGNAEDVYVSIDTTRPPNRYVPPSILEHWLYAFDMPGIVCDREFRSDNRFPETGTGELLDSRVDVNGAVCDIVEKDRYRYFLDPSLDYAVRKREWRYKGRLVFEVVGEQFTELLPAVWLPRRVVATNFSTDGSEIPLYRSVYVVEKLEANQSEHERFFSVSPPPGAVVIDENRKPVDATGETQLPTKEDIIPSVTYTQPADKADVEAVAAAAAKEQGDSLASWRLRHAERDIKAHGGVFRSAFIWLNLGVVVALLTLFLFRRFSGK